MSVSEKDGGLPPDSVVEDEDRILAESERLVSQFHDPSPDSMLRLALAPCSPFSVSTRLMTATAELAERLDVRLHTHFAEDPDEDAYCLAAYGLRPYELLDQVGWAGSRSWVAHCVYPSGGEITKLAVAGVAGRALSELEHDDRARSGADRRAASRRRRRWPRVRWILIDGLGLVVARGSDSDALCPSSPRPRCDRCP